MPSGPINVGDAVREALSAGAPVVALESAVLTHGLPHPQNLQAAGLMEAAVRGAGAVPALCLVLAGQLHVGASAEEAAKCALDPGREKASIRDLGAVVAGHSAAGLTVSATLFAAHRCGIRVFATGGIGGVHIPSDLYDISADLPQLARSPVLTVCSGAKSILNIPATLEVLETLGVPVLGYRTDSFPGFYVESSGEPVQAAMTCVEIVRIVRSHWALGLLSGLVVGNPIPPEAAISSTDWQGWLQAARESAGHRQIRGKALTPFLLGEVARLSEGRTVQANLALLESNARLAGEIAALLAA
jgi:pseudouridylate synthase